MASRQHHKLRGAGEEEQIIATKSASARIWASIAKAASMSGMVLAFRTVICCPTLRAAV